QHQRRPGPHRRELPQGPEALTNGANDYHFVTRWTVTGTCEEVSAVLGDPLDLPRWWPTVYLQVAEVRPPDAGGLGRRVRLLTKGRRPRTLPWWCGAGQARPRGRCGVGASGGLDGTGGWPGARRGPAGDSRCGTGARSKSPLATMVNPCGERDCTTSN